MKKFISNLWKVLIILTIIGLSAIVIVTIILLLVSTSLISKTMGVLLIFSLAVLAISNTLGQEK